MSRYIDIDDISLRKTVAVGGMSAKALWRRIQEAPSIDIVRCKECVHWHKWSDGEMFCGCLDGGIGSDADDFCSYGERSEQ